VTLSQGGLTVACGRATTPPPCERHAVLVHPSRSPGAAARQTLLRQEVGRFRVRESRRVFDLAVHVGRLGAARDTFVVPARDLPVMDVGLRIDVASSLVEGTDDDWREAWVTRPGTPQVHDLDLQWLAAVSEAFAIHGRTLEGFWVVTRFGWRDALTEEARVWKRLRL
jgi:hypothetical protein